MCFYHEGDECYMTKKLWTERNKIKLPFSRYEVSYNPADSAVLSILGGNKNIIEICNCLWQVFSFEFYQDGDQYFDAHLWHATPVIQREFVDRVLFEEDICAEFENVIENGKYIFAVLDRSEISEFSNNNFFPHLVTIYGVDKERKIFYAADFGENSGYSLYELAYKELNCANQSVNLKIRDLECRHDVLAWISQFEFMTYIDSGDKKLDWTRQRGEISAVLNCEQYTPIDNIKNTSIARFQNEKIVLVPITGVQLGIDVFFKMIEHLKKALQDNTYIVERKHFYFLYEYATLLGKRFELICGFGNNKKNYDILCIQSIICKFRICLLNEIKYEITGNKEILRKAVYELEYNIELLIQEIKKYENLIQEVD